MAKHVKINCDREFIAGTAEFKACMAHNAALDAKKEPPAKNVFQMLIGHKEDVEKALRQ